MTRDKSVDDARLRQAVDAALADSRPSVPASKVFARLRALHAERQALDLAERGSQGTAMKVEALLKLARLRQSTRRNGYDCIGAFHDGLFECDHVSPWTKSGHNVDAEIMVVGQDWSSQDVLARDPPDLEVARLGFDARFPTNANLDDLLKRHFGLARGACYLTNLFPFIKGGRANAAIPMKDLVWAAETFTLPEIRIVSPRLVICLGRRAFIALLRASGAKGSPRLDQAIKSPFASGDAMIYCVAHTGALGTNNRGREQVARDWSAMADDWRR
jgi:restriction system protein